MKKLEQLLHRKKSDPYITYRARVEQERITKKLPANAITVEEFNWKMAEVDERYNNIPEEIELQFPSIGKLYSDAKSLSGTIIKAGRVNRKQWNKLVNISFNLLEASYLRAN